MSDISYEVDTVRATDTKMKGIKVNMQKDVYYITKAEKKETTWMSSIFWMLLILEEYYAALKMTFMFTLDKYKQHKSWLC